MTESNLKKGFTLIELIIVIALLGVLTTAGLTSYSASQKKGRDAKRKSDLNNLTKVLEMYYNDQGRYPGSSAGKIVSCGTNCNSACTWGDAVSSICHKVGTTQTIYMKKIPADPRSTNQYYYTTDASGSYYVTYASLEDANDSQIITDTTNADCGPAVGVQPCNIGVSSSDVIPGTAPGPTLPGPSSTPVPTPT